MLVVDSFLRKPTIRNGLLAAIARLKKQPVRRKRHGQL